MEGEISKHEVRCVRSLKRKMDAKIGIQSKNESGIEKSNHLLKASSDGPNAPLESPQINITENLIECEICQKKIDKTDIEIHILNHIKTIEGSSFQNSDRKKCRICNQALSGKSLKTHLITHFDNSETIARCIYCNIEIRYDKINNHEKFCKRRKKNIDTNDEEEIRSREDLELMEDNVNIDYVITHFEEGKIISSIVNRYERNPQLRERAIQIHGTICQVCGFEFEKVYGKIGKGYIEVHHKNPLSKLGSSEDVDPKKDLVVVCANCHRMIHRQQNKIIPVSDLKMEIKKVKT